MLQRLLPLLLVFVGLTLGPAWGGSPPPVTGVVIRVVDGDTLHVTTSAGKREKVRVYGVDAPERRDPCFQEATDFAKSLVAGRQVTLLPRGRDKYGRLLAFVVVVIHPRQGEPERRSLGLELVRRGLAVVYSTRYRPADDDTYRKYQDAQIGAMENRLCIWGGH